MPCSTKCYTRICAVSVFSINPFILLLLQLSNCFSRWNFQSNCASRGIVNILNTTLRKKCPYSELFWSTFSSIRTDYGQILRIFLRSANPTKWSNTLKQFVGYCQWIVWVCLTIFGSCCLKRQDSVKHQWCCIFFTKKLHDGILTWS